MPKKLTQEEVIRRFVDTHGNRYDYSKVEYINGNTKVEIICSKHNSFFQTPFKHSFGRGCPRCWEEKRGKSNIHSKEMFVEKAMLVHGNIFDYSKVKYIRSKQKVEIICKKHGSFWQTPSCHKAGDGCPHCGGTRKLTNEKFILRAKKIHKNKYDYSRVKYINNRIKVEINCPKHGAFFQTPDSHLSGKKCRKCSLPGIGLKNKPSFEGYSSRLEEIGVRCFQGKQNKRLLNVKCFYCGKIFQPTIKSVCRKIEASTKINQGEANLYCSNNCKEACPTYGQILHEKGFGKLKQNSISREMQPYWRRLILERDNQQCTKCGKGPNEEQLHAHHIDPYRTNYDSMTIDNGITLCRPCHQEVHRQEGCRASDIRKECV